MTFEYLRDCLTLARAPDSSAIEWQLFAFVPDFRNFGFSKSRRVGNRKTKVLATPLGFEATIAPP
jgi:hypothetical protein